MSVLPPLTLIHLAPFGRRSFGAWRGAGGDWSGGVTIDRSDREREPAEAFGDDNPGGLFRRHLQADGASHSRGRRAGNLGAGRGALGNLLIDGDHADHAQHRFGDDPAAERRLAAGELLRKDDVDEVAGVLRDAGLVDVTTNVSAASQTVGGRRPAAA